MGRLVGTLLARIETSSICRQQLLCRHFTQNLSFANKFFCVLSRLLTRQNYITRTRSSKYGRSHIWQLCHATVTPYNIVSVSQFKVIVMYLLEWKTVVCRTNSSLRPHITTSTVHQETPGFTNDAWAGLEGRGMLNEMTNVSGWRLTLEGLLKCHGLPLKVDRMLTSGSQVTMCPIVSRDSGLWLIRSMEGQRLVIILVMDIRQGVVNKSTPIQGDASQGAFFSIQDQLYCNYFKRNI